VATLRLGVELKNIAKMIQSCTKCPLHQTRTQAVPGSGNLNAKVVFVGEAPGYYEDQKGIPFIGRGGQLLTKKLGELGISREDVFITNIAKCRPPNNRRPEKTEVEACTPYLNMQLETLTPKFIVPLGAVAGEYIFKKYGLTWTGMLKENGIKRQVSTIFGTLTIVPVIHPAAVLRNPHRTGIF